MTFGIALTPFITGAENIFDSSTGLSGFRISGIGSTTDMAINMPEAGWVAAAPPKGFTSTGNMGLYMVNAVADNAKMQWTGGGSFRYCTIDPLVGQQLAMGAGEYGLEVYNSNGPGNAEAKNVLFTTKTERMASILAAGYFGVNNTSGTFTVPIPSTVGADNVFVMLNGTAYYQSLGNEWPLYGTLRVYVNFEWDYTGTTKKVYVKNYLTTVVNNQEGPRGVYPSTHNLVPWIVIQVLGNIDPD